MTPNLRTRRRQSLRQPKGNYFQAGVICAGLTAVFIFVSALWVCITSISSVLQAHRPNSPMPMPMPPTPVHNFFRRENGDGGGKGAGSSSATDRNSRNPPRVVGNYAYRVSEGYGQKGYNTERPPYIYLTERLDTYLLSHSSQTLRRMRQHNYYHPKDTTLSDVVHNYNLAIADSNAEVEAEDPLRHLMLSSKSRDILRSIEEDSEDYEHAIADPLEDEECEAVPKNERWMLHSFPTCNFLHEFDFTLALRKQETWLLGHGYWRDVWPVLDMEPSTLASEKKVAMKTIRYEHDYTDRNFARHVRDAIVSERMTSSPRVTDIHSFCGHTGFFEFASGGSLADRLEEHYLAKMEKSDDEDNEGRPDSGKENDDDRILDKRAKLSLAHAAAAGLADFHDTDAMRDEHGKITSAAMVHADITADQFVNIDGIWKLNDFNRCRFMRRHRGTGGDSGGGDGEPCGFYIQNNPAKCRSPEEYMYIVETEKIDIYSLGNVFYQILTDMDPWEDTEEEEAQKAVVLGKRPEVPESIESSDDPYDNALLKVMHDCWEHKPEDRPRAREVADFLAEKLTQLDHEDNKEAGGKVSAE